MQQRCGPLKTAEYFPSFARFWTRLNPMGFDHIDPHKMVGAIPPRPESAGSPCAFKMKNHDYLR